jgi:hypothetical protein
LLHGGKLGKKEKFLDKGEGNDKKLNSQSTLSSWSRKQEQRQCKQGGISCCRQPLFWRR